MKALLVAALGLAASSQVEPFAGVYTEVGELHACRLEITPRSAFVLSCPDQKEIPGTVEAWGEALAFGVSPDAFHRHDPEYWKAYHAFTQQHFVEHGSYPVVFPPNTPDVLIPLVPVAGPRAQFLVEPSERADFCAALVAGREPGASKRRSAVFRKAGGTAIAGTPWRCSARRAGSRTS
jgi:hypothetical protein